VLAWQLTRAYSKDEILALYLNQIYYGGMAYGIEAASQTYFGKPASDLLLPECALLAGLPQTPGIYNPFTNPDLALERQKVVLGLMEKNGFISEVERVEAENAPLSYNAAPYPIEAPHFVWIIKDQLDELFASGQLNQSQSLVIRTTLDLNMQHLAEGSSKGASRRSPRRRTQPQREQCRAGGIHRRGRNPDVGRQRGLFRRIHLWRAQHGDCTEAVRFGVQAHYLRRRV
jgi:membrane peptidoglycan carboxypeptidase